MVLAEGITSPMPSPRQASGPTALSALDASALAGIRVVATDVDGTLTRAGKLSAALLSSFAALAEAGLTLIPISGRPAGEVLGLCRYLPGVTFGVAENGLFEIVPDRAPRWLGPPSDRAELLAVGEHLNRDHAAQLVLTGDAFCRIGDVAYERAGREVPELERLRTAAEARGVHLVWSSVHVHLAARRPDKGEGLLQLLGERGLDPRSVVTVGDAPNDAGLFTPGRFGLTVGTADVLAQRGDFPHLPDCVTRAREVEGFLELARRLLARTG